MKLTLGIGIIYHCKYKTVFFYHKFISRCHFDMVLQFVCLFVCLFFLNGNLWETKCLLDVGFNAHQGCLSQKRVRLSDLIKSTNHCLLSFSAFSLSILNLQQFYRLCFNKNIRLNKEGDKNKREIVSSQYSVSGCGLACQQQISLVQAKTLPIHYQAIINSEFSNYAQQLRIYCM